MLLKINPMSGPSWKWWLATCCTPNWWASMRLYTISSANAWEPGNVGCASPRMIGWIRKSSAPLARRWPRASNFIWYGTPTKCLKLVLLHMHTVVAKGLWKDKGRSRMFPHCQRSNINHLNIYITSCCFFLESWSHISWPLVWKKHAHCDVVLGCLECCSCDVVLDVKDLVKHLWQWMGQLLAIDSLNIEGDISRLGSWAACRSSWKAWFQPVFERISNISSRGCTKQAFAYVNFMIQSKEFQQYCKSDNAKCIGFNAVCIQKCIMYIVVCTMYNAVCIALLLS